MATAYAIGAAIALAMLGLFWLGVLWLASFGADVPEQSHYLNQDAPRAYHPSGRDGD